MSDRRCDIQVGLFSIIAVVLLAMMILIFGGFKDVLAETYRVTAHFPNAAGATEGTPVRLLGIDVGKVTSIVFDPETGEVRMLLTIDKKVDIRMDAPLAIKQEGFIANIYLEFSGGMSRETLAKDGTASIEGRVDTFASYIERATTVLSDMGGAIDKKVSDVTDRLATLIDNLNSITGDEEFRDNLKELAANTSRIAERLQENLPDLIDNLNAAAVTAQEDLEKGSQLLDTYRDLGEELRETAGAAREQLDRQGANLDKLTASLTESAEDISKLAESLTEITEIVKSGQGSAGKLFTETDLYNSLVASIDMLADAAEEFRDLAETIKKHPDWIVKGPPKKRRK
ncbi:MAG: MCE family protein [Planctomycetes bacterium]|nr:MCE family protein [Planctomycetota bacterium]